MDLSLRELLSIDPSHFTIEERENIVRWIRSGKTGLSEEQLHAIKRKFCHGEWQREENRRKEAQADKLKKSEERRWERLTSPGPRDGVPYRVSHADLAMLARRWPPPNPGNRVTDFTDWIYRLYRPQPPLGALGRGKRDETEIAARKPLKETRNWRLLHDGTGDKSANALKISELCVNGRPMRGSPDFVFEHRDSGQVLIVEIKSTEVDPIPADGWPNLRAQLWAYGHIDEYRTRPSVLLVGEIWRRSREGWYVQAIHWTREDERFHAENAELFDIYRSGRTDRRAAPSDGVDRI